jgi:6-phosphofructokinase 1
MEVVADKSKSTRRCGSNFSIIVVAEGAIEIGHDLIYQDKGDSLHAPRLGGIGNHLQRDLESGYRSRDTLCCTGHLQRGGRPNAFDRMLADQLWFMRRESSRQRRTRCYGGFTGGRRRKCPTGRGH